MSNDLTEEFEESEHENDKNIIIVPKNAFVVWLVIEITIKIYFHNSNKQPQTLDAIVSIKLLCACLLAVLSKHYKFSFTLIDRRLETECNIV